MKNILVLILFIYLPIKLFSQKEISDILNRNQIDINQTNTFNQEIEIINELKEWTIDHLSFDSSKKVINEISTHLSLIEDTCKIVNNKLHKNGLSKHYFFSQLLFSTDSGEIIIAKYSARFSDIHINDFAPVIFFKSKNQLYYSDLGKLDIGMQTGKYQFMGLLNKDNHIPDILLSLEPLGSGSRLFLIQLHFDGKKWNSIWSSDVSFSLQYSFNNNTNVLNVSYLYDKWKTDKANINFKFKWGQAPQIR